MSAECSYREQFNVTKRIPLHYQKRYWANISNGSFNASLTGAYKQKIVTVLKNNKLLALALEKEKEKKEELLAESKLNADLIMFSRLKLARMSDNLKKVVVELDETVTLLEMHSSSCLPKFTPKNTISRKEFKELIKGVSLNTITEERESCEIDYPTESLMYLPSLSPKFKTCEETSVHTRENLYPISCKRLCDQSSQSSILKKAKSKLETIVSKLDGSSNPFIACQLDLPVDTLSIKKQTSKGSTSPKLKKNKQVIQKRLSQVVKSSENIIGKVENKDQNFKSVPGVNNVAEDLPNASSKKLPRKSTKIKGNRDPKNTHIFKQPLNSQNTNKSTAVNLRDIDINIKNTEINVSCLNNQTEYEDRNCRNALIDYHLPNKNEVDSVCTTCFKPISKTSNVKKNLIEQVQSTTVEDDSEKIIGSDYSTECQEINDTETNLHVNNFKVFPGSDFPNFEKLKEKKVFKKPNLKNVFEEEEIVEKLAKSSLLVRTEVHEFPHSKISGEGVQHQNIDCKVVLNDIFKANKPLCKSISWPTNDETNKTPLDLQFEHCASPKLILSSTAVRKEKLMHVKYQIGNCDDQNTKDHFMESLSAMENGYKDPSNEDKRRIRRRASMISYKEPSLNIKLRR